MILTHESGFQEDQFDGKKNGGKKSRDTIPLRDPKSDPLLKRTVPDQQGSKKSL
jgi:hypothetical protein